MTGRDKVLAAALDVLPYPKEMAYHEWRSWVRTFVDVLFDNVKTELRAEMNVLAPAEDAERVEGL